MDYQQLEKEKKAKLNKLAKAALDSMPDDVNLSTYDDLLSLPPKTKRLLSEMEELHVDIIDCGNEYIDGQTSGHHREIRDILAGVLKDSPRDKCYTNIYMDENGVLEFDLKKRVSCFADC